MLMTNFSAGELSKYLLGRIDIPQYKNGAARIENFNVIPTGGIKRRSGMEWLENLEGDGRLMPFIVDREQNFLLYLAPNDMQAFRVTKGGVAKEPISIGGEVRLYGDSAHIRQAQYAQNYDTMVLCHELYAPIEVKYENDALRVSLLAISFRKAVVAGNNVSDDDSFIYRIKDDEAYSGSGWLSQAGHYPASASFFNGRLIFAGTISSRQRIFASAIKEAAKPHNFSTVKTFLTEKKVYIVVQGTVEKEPLDEVVIEVSEGLKFISRLEDYFVDSPFFDSDAKIVSLKANILKMSKPAKITVKPPDLEAGLDNMVKHAEEKDAFPKSDRREIAAYRVPFYIETKPGEYSVEYYTHRFYITSGATKIKIEGISDNNRIDFYPHNRPPYIFPLPHDAVSQYEKDSTYYSRFVEDKIKNKVHFGIGLTLNESPPSLNTENVSLAIDALTAYSTSTMRYRLVDGDVDQTFYNYPWELERIVLRRYDNAGRIFIPFYTREIISDEYPTPDCGFTFEIASDMNDAIRWLSVNRGLIVGTEMGEYIIPPDVHALNQRAEKNSSYGSDHVQGTAVGDATVFLQAGKKSLVEYYIPQADNHFRANNMALLSQEMLGESPARELDYITSPYTKLLVTREDGTVAALLYERSTGTFAWSRITTGPERIEGLDKFRRKTRLKVLGKVRSAAVLPGRGGFDEVYMIVERHGKFALERLRENGPVFLDCWREWKWGPGTEYATREALLAAYGEGAVIWDEVENRKDPDNMAKKDPADEKLFRRMEERFADDLPKFDDSITREYVRVTARLDVPKFKEFLAYLKIPPEERERMKEEAAQKEREERKKSQKYKSAISLIPIGSADKLPPESADEEPRYIGYPYTSILRTMPVIGNAEMQQHRISSLAFRFLDSFLPHMTSIRKGEPGPTDCLTHAEAPCTGIYEQPFPGTWDEQVQAELYADVPGPVTILTLDAITSKPHAGGAK